MSDRLKIVITDFDTVTAGDIDMSVFDRYGDVTYYNSTAPNEVISRVQGADVLLCNKTPVTDEVIAACPKLRYIGLFATGYNNIDIPCARSAGIAVCNAGGYSTDAVAQLVFALMLEIFTNTASYLDYTRSGGWMTSPTFSAFVFPQRELCGKTIGIVGYGSIGSAVARIAEAFGMRVLVHTRTPKLDDSVNYCSFEELLTQSDVVSVHCPLTDRTERMFNNDTFSLFRDGAVFINTSRGGVVDEPALRDALLSGKLSAAALDVLAFEPMREDSPLIGVPNLYITPHIGWAPLETRLRLVDIVRANLEAWMGGKPVNVVC